MSPRPPARSSRHDSEDRAGHVPGVSRLRSRGIDALVLRTSGGARALIALTGATLLSWHVPTSEGLLDLVDGYRDAAELEAQDGVRNGILAPFSNRVADARYVFEGSSYDLLPRQPPGGRLVYHGLLRTVETRLVGARSAGDGVELVVGTRLRGGDHPGYPFDLDLAVTYALAENALDVQVAVRNAGARPAPYACGWHPYFRLSPAAVDDLELTVPAETLIRTDDRLIPLAGASGTVPLDSLPAMDFRTGPRIGARVIDACYADLAASADGLLRTRLFDTATGRALTVWQEHGLLHVFTGDTLARGRRRSIALEPVELPTNAFNEPRFAPALRLEPGATRSFSFGVRAEIPA